MTMARSSEEPNDGKSVTFVGSGAGAGDRPGDHDLAARSGYWTHCQNLYFPLKLSFKTILLYFKVITRLQVQPETLR